MLVAVLGLLGVFAIMGALASYLMTAQRQQSASATPAAAAAEDEDEVLVQGGGRRAGGARMRASRARQRAQQQQQQQQAAQQQRWQDSDADSEGEAGEAGEDEDGAPLTRKEAKRRERAAQREAERAAREAKANRVSGYEERRRKREEDREAAERAQEEEVARAAEERRRAEDAEAARWMGRIAVEGAGEDAADEGSGGGSLAERFVAYVQQRKMVGVEELATEFGLRSQEVVDRLGALEAQGLLTGVMDERGKYIHISAEEMAAVAGFIRSRGRVAIAELAARSSDLIDLDPRAAAADHPGGAAAGGRGAAGGGQLDLDALLADEVVAAA